MSPAAQLIIVIGAIVAAAAYVGWNFWRRVTKPESSSGCGNCGNAAPAASPVVPLETLTSSIDALKPPRN